MSTQAILCQRCQRPLRGVAFIDFEKDTVEGELDVYCGPCSKTLERTALRDWAEKWAKGLTTEENYENFFSVLAAIWEQGFTKARTFEETRTVFEVSDNPFIDESELIDPLLTEIKEKDLSIVNKYVDEDEYYEQNPTFKRA